jgi:hypothetical protein
MTDSREKTLVARRHPDYTEMYEHWCFLESTFKGGRQWFDTNIFKYHKEGQDEFASRKKRAYRFNHTKEIVELVNKYVFRGDISRIDDAPESVQKFWKSSAKRGWPIEELLPSFSRWASVYGRIWVVVDASTAKNADGSKVETKEDMKKVDYRNYAYFIKPQDFLDCGWDDNGNMLWALVRESYRDDSDPFGDHKNKTRYRLWTQDGYNVYKPSIGDDHENFELSIDDSGVTNLGMVPIIPLDDMTSSEEFTSPSLIADIAYLDRAVANYLSNLDAIIQDQTFSQLAMPAQSQVFDAVDGDDEEGEDAQVRKKMIEMGTKRVFLYDAEGGKGSAPFYLSPDPKQAELLITAIKQIINEIYHSVGVAGERTKQDNSAGIDNSSGVAKAYDFERVNSLLSNKGRALERFENKMCELVLAWNEDTHVEGKKYVKYPESYDARTFVDELNISERLEAITAPIELKKHQLKRGVEKLYPHMSEKVKKDLNSAIDNMDDMLDALKSNGPLGNDNALPNEQNQGDAE